MENLTEALAGEVSLLSSSLKLECQLQLVRLLRLHDGLRSDPLFQLMPIHRR